jgi:type IV pilus assembly protein PilA
MNTFKKNGGFTLVELIIVIAILAILSAVAVAGYATYINKANDSAAESFMENVETHIVLANAMAGEVGTIEFTTDGDNVVVKVTKATPGFADDFKDNIEDNLKATEYDATNEGYVTFKLAAPSAWKNSSYKNGASNATGEWVGK